MMRTAVISAMAAALLAMAAPDAWGGSGPTTRTGTRPRAKARPAGAARTSGAAAAPNARAKPEPAVKTSGGDESKTEPPAQKSGPPEGIFEQDAPAAPANQIDRAVLGKLSAMKIKPVLCSDAVFVRRVYLDVIGTLPTAKEAGEFIRSTDRNKRAALIDRLLDRPEFADYWSMKWGDVLRIKAEFPVNLWPNAAQAYHHWVRESIASNKPYDQFVRELLTSSGSNFRVGPVNFYRAIQNRTPEGIAAAAALAFMGSRIESWPKDRQEGLAVFFAQVGYKPTREWKEECVFWDPLRSAGPQGGAGDANAPPGPPPTPKPVNGVLPDGTKLRLLPNRDPREVFADWLIKPANGWFTRSIANRIWAWLLGRGVIHEPDDIRDGNPPSNPELLACLEKDLQAGRYDLKRLYRLILNSSTYQLSSMPRNTSPQGRAQFAAYPLRRLDAEVLIDALNKITGTTDLYTSPIPEPFTYIPADLPAIAIADGSITSSFLALFGRSARATGLENERDNKPVPAQWLHMMNSSHVQRKLEMSVPLRTIVDAKRRPAETVEELYLTILSRFPTAEEVTAALDYQSTAPPSRSGRPARSGAAARPTYKNRNDWLDIAWALINSVEFLYRH